MYFLRAGRGVRDILVRCVGNRGDIFGVFKVCVDIFVVAPGPVVFLNDLLDCFPRDRFFHNGSCLLKLAVRGFILIRLDGDVRRDAAAIDIVVIFRTLPSERV